MSENGARKMIDRFVIEAEDAINKLVARIEQAERELSHLRRQEAEARATYHGLRQMQKDIAQNPGQAEAQARTQAHVKAIAETPIPAHKHKKSFVSEEDFIAAIEAMEYKEFTASDIADLTGQKRNAAQMRLKGWAETKRMVRITDKGGEWVPNRSGRTPMKFRQLRPPV